MITSQRSRWLGTLQKWVLETHTDTTALIPIETDDYTLVIFLRKSPLKFIIQQSREDSNQFAVLDRVKLADYALGPPRTGSDSGLYYPAIYVEVKLDQWLRRTVAGYLTDHRLSD